MSYREDGPTLRLDRQAQARLAGAIDLLSPGWSSCHVLTDTPGQFTDLYIVLLDGVEVLRFKLPRSGKPAPQDVERLGLEQFRREVGQGKFRLMVERAVEDARTMTGNVR
jgi:hypothetical protein